MPPSEVPPAREVLSEAELRFEHLRRRAGFYLAPLACLVCYFLTRGRLPPEGSRLSAILAFALVLWMTEAVPLPVTAVLAPCLCIIVGVAEAKVVLAPFADPVVFLFIGSFMLARAMTLHGLDRRFALAMLSLRWVRGHPTRMLAALGLATALLSMWVSNTATAAMMLPIALGVLRALEKLRPEGSRRSGGNDSRGKDSAPTGDLFASGVMLMIAYAASIGGIGTPVGTAPNLIGLGLIRKLAGVEISFFRWMALCVPMLAVMFLFLLMMLQRLHPATGVNGNQSDLTAYLGREREALGTWTSGQVNTLIAFGIAVLLWVGPGLLPLIVGETHGVATWAKSRLPEGVVALLAASLLFMLPTNRARREFTLNWEQAAQIDWGTVLLFGGGLSLGGLMFSTGVAKSLGEAAIGLMGQQSLWGLTAAATAMGIILSETTSNTASANMVIPVVIALAQGVELNPVPPALGACLGASYGFMLPVSTPPNAIVYGSGLVPIPRMIKAGIIFDIFGFVIIVVGLRILCPVLGLVD